MKLKFTVDNPGGTFYQNFWHDRAKDVELPLWHRLYSLAYSDYRGNRHAFYGAGALTEYFGKSSSQVKHAIDKAVGHGFLAVGSNLCCLIVPDQFGGGVGRSQDGCPDPKHRRMTKKLNG